MTLSLPDSRVIDHDDLEAVFEHPIRFKWQDVHNEVAKRYNIKIQLVYDASLDYIVSGFKPLSRKVVVSTMVHHGWRKLSHIYSHEISTLKKERDTQRPLKDAIAIKSIVSNLFPRSENGVRCKELTVYVDSDTVYAPIAEFAGLLGYPVSDVTHISLAIAILDWENPREGWQEYRDVFHNNLQDFEKHVYRRIGLYDRQVHTIVIPTQKPHTHIPTQS